jgi:SlyX protein
MTNDELEARIIELETRLAYQDDTVLALNNIVAEQQRHIDQLESSFKLLIARVTQIAAATEAAEPTAVEIPPHY